MRTPRLAILVDACVGNDKERRVGNGWNMRRDESWLARLAAAGCAPEDIDIVLCTHLHLDHVGWNTRLVDGRWVPSFPNARYLFARSEYEFWREKSAKDPRKYDDGAFADSVLPVVEAGRHALVDGDHEIDAGIRLEPSPGHTPGHVNLRLESRGLRAVLCGDLMHTVLQCVWPDWSSAGVFRQGAVARPPAGASSNAIARAATSWRQRISPRRPSAASSAAATPGASASSARERERHARLAVLDRPRRHLHRRRRAGARRPADEPQTPLGKPPRYKDATLQGIRDVLGLAADAPLPTAEIDAVKMGTTVATNALLERRGEPCLLVTTRGFADALRIGYQNRPRLFDRHIVLPDMLFERVVEVDERVAADGRTLRPLDEAGARAALAEAREAGLRACAILFMHGWRYEAHERRVAELAREAGFTQVSASHAVAPLMKLVGRGDTAVADAYLSPVIGRYVAGVAAATGDARLMFMQSNGGLADARHFRGKDAILSGPAGGVVGAARTAAAAGFERIVGFDMGGTSTDVSWFDGTFERTFDNRVAGVRVGARR